MAIHKCQFHSQSEGTVVLVVCCCITNYPNTLQLKAMSMSSYILCYRIDSVVQGSRCSVAGCLSWSCSWTVSQGCCLIWRLYWGRIISKVIHVVVDRPRHVGLFIGLPHYMQLASPRASNLREWEKASAQEENHGLFMSSSQRWHPITSAVFCSRSESLGPALTQGEEVTQGHEGQ